MSDIDSFLGAANPADFAQVYGGAAQLAADKLGVDPKALLAQWGLETGWGKSIVPGTNNLGNIKDLTGGGVGATDNQNGSKDKYRAFESPEAFADHYVGLVGRKYRGVVGAGSDINKFSAGLSGYAEDPRYADKLQAAYRTVSGATNPVRQAAERVTSAVFPSANAQTTADSDLPRIEISGTASSKPSEVDSFLDAQNEPYKSVGNKPVAGMDRARAAAAGVNKGFWSDLAGLPVDTAANVVDLAKAGYGTLIAAAGRPDLAPEVSLDRSNVVGSSDWIAKNINKGANALGMPSPIDNPNPQDQSSRVLYSGGRVGGASIVPNPRAAISASQTAANIARGGVAGLAGGAVGEVAPDYAGVAAMAPSVAGRTAADTMRYLVRGGEAGSRNMLQRMQDLKAAGVDEPTLGLASGNKLVQGVENLLALTPGTNRLFEASRQKALEGIQGKTNALRDTISPVYGAVETGNALTADLKGPFKNRIFSTYDRLNNRVEQAVGPNALIPVDGSINTANRLATPIPGAEATSSNFLNSRIRKMGNDLSADAGGKPAQTVNSLILGADGQPAVQTVIPATAPQGVPFSAVKDLRTRIGKEAASSSIVGTPEQGEFKQMYGALSQDMKNGVRLADLQNGTKGEQALERANAYYSRAMDRVEALDSMANRSTPEGAYNALAKSTNAGPTTLERTRNAVSVDTRRKVAATIIDDMGRAMPGQQNAQGSEWSTRTFMTNFSKMDPEARSALFKRMPGGAKYEENLNEIAKAADMLNQSSKVWANPSGTAMALTNRGTVYGLTVGAYFNPVLAAGTAVSLVGANVASRLMTNPQFVNWLAKAPQIKPQDAQSFGQRLVSIAKLSGDKQFQQDVDQYLSSVK